jgi:hypothetical protein
LTKPQNEHIFRPGFRGDAVVEESVPAKTEGGLHMFWKIFGSERKVQEAVEKSVDYDISPKTIQMPANTDTAPDAVRGVRTLELDGGGQKAPQKKKA